MSERITFTADDATVHILDAVEQRDDIDSTAAAVRQCITDSVRLQRECDALQHLRARDREQYEREIAELRDRVDYLENRERVILDEREEKAELVRYVEDERTAAERWRQASLLTKAKWAVTGMPNERD